MKGATGKSADEKTYSSLDRPDPTGDQELPTGAIVFAEADLSHVLEVYQSLSHRTLIHSTALPAVKISLQNETPLSRHEALQALDSVLAQNGITMIPMGTKFIKAVPSAQASTEAPPLIDLPASQLPDSSSYMMYIVELKMARPREVAPALQPFAKMPNSIIAVDSSGIIIIRDYSANIRRMLKVAEKIEVPDAPETPPTEKKP
jgi:type II secretory pathway component GspD/PulD (secretin)